MPTYIVKPPVATWQPDRAPAGSRLYLPMHEGAGARTRDLAGVGLGTFVGTPTWGRGPYGGQIGGFTTSNYITVSPIPARAYPFWQAYLFVNTVTTTGATLGGWTNTGGSNPAAIIRVNGDVVSRPDYFLRDDAGGGPVASLSAASGSATPNDGLPHVLMASSHSTVDHRLYWDGRLVGSSSTSVGTITTPVFTVGVMRRTTVSGAFGGSTIAVLAGSGSVPDAMALAQDLLSGRFAAMRPRRDLVAFAGVTAAGGAPVAGPVLFHSHYSNMGWR